MERLHLTLIIDKLQRLFWVVLLISLCSIQCKISAATAAEDYFIFQENDKKGLRNSKDKVVIPAEYDDLGWSIGGILSG